MAKQKEAQRTRIRIRKNDLVEVLAGKDRGKRGKVLMVLPEKARVLDGEQVIDGRVRRGGMGREEGPTGREDLILEEDDSGQVDLAGCPAGFHDPERRGGVGHRGGNSFRPARPACETRRQGSR